jgi:hypothetical protein
MKLYQFSRLTDDEQYHTIWSSGIHVDSYTTDNLVINLYVIDNFTASCIIMCGPIKFSTKRVSNKEYG